LLKAQPGPAFLMAVIQIAESSVSVYIQNATEKAKDERKNDRLLPQRNRTEDESDVARADADASAITGNRIAIGPAAS
jgi:hypothetical protein